MLANRARCPPARRKPPIGRTNEWPSHDIRRRPSLTTLFRPGRVVRRAATPERGSSRGGLASRWRTLRRWLQPGLGVKRWLLAMVVGTVLFGLAAALLLLNLYNSRPQHLLVSVLGLGGPPHPLRILVLPVGGGFLIYLFLFQLKRTS